MLLANPLNMIAAERRVSPRRSKSMAQLERDAALVRVSRLRRWTIGGAAALTAGFAAFVSAIAPGHSLGAARAARGESAARGAATAPRSVRLPPLARPSQLGLQGPSSNPQPAPSATQQSASPPTQQSAPPPTQQAAPAPAPAPSGATSGGS
jgi:hypothetical protein